MITKNCQICDKQYRLKPYRAEISKFCSHPCYAEYRRINKMGSVLTKDSKRRISEAMAKRNKRMWADPDYRAKNIEGIRRSRKYGAESPLWQGGYYINKNGYKVLEWRENFKRQRILEHRLVMEKHLGRKLASGETIHHINHNKLDNRPENLTVLDRSTHTKIHHPKTLTKCLVESCPELFHARGFCRTHWTSWRKGRLIEFGEFQYK